MSSTTTPEGEAERLVDEFAEETRNEANYQFKPDKYASGKALLKASPEVQAAAVMALERRCYPFDPVKKNTHQLAARNNLLALQGRLLGHHLPLSSVDLETLVVRASVHEILTMVGPLQRFKAAGNKLTPKMHTAIESILAIRRIWDNAYYRKNRLVLEEILGTADDGLVPDAGDTWADLLLADLAKMDEATALNWRQLLAVAQTADGGKPKSEWQDSIAPPMQTLGEKFAPAVARWFSAVSAPVTGHSTDRNTQILKGLAWACVGEKSPEVARALAKLVEGTLKKVPGIGPWGVRAATAAVWALSEMPSPEAVPELVRLRNRVKHRTTLNSIEKAIEAVAQRAGLPREEMEDLAVPTYGLELDGTAREEFGECYVTVRLTPEGKVETQWYGANEKPVKSIPAAVRKDHADDLKDFKASVDGLSKMLTAQRDRLERALFPPREWNLGKWREQYLEHPLLGHLTHRLLWRVTEGERTEIVLPVGDQLTDEKGDAVADFSDAATIRLFHPLHTNVETILRWREVLEGRGIVQPFKQAHREVYILTDAEMNTRIYSNRYAGHILKQHQFNSLCALRGWKNQLFLMVDDANGPPTLELPTYNLRVEFWVEGVGNTYGTDTNDTGTYYYIATDQVRFYPLNAPRNRAHAWGGGYAPEALWEVVNGQRVRQPVEDAPIPLNEIPPLVLSEVLRDIDLFVGVASVGNDPTWSDGGPAGLHRAYWTEYAFGELSASAKTRAEVLARLMPRLKIADRTRMEGRFLYVRGDRRTYKIHLGSGNILMEPNDQYLCIVEGRSAENAANPLFLPFEGDSRLSLILSKAFLLANDTKITDQSIVRQIVG